MALILICLRIAEWEFDPERPLAPSGGFGTVYEGIDDSGNPVAVKQIRRDLADEAHREIAIADDLIGEEFGHVLPILDAGYDEGSGYFYIVMPMAGHHLNKYLSDKGILTESEAVDILLQIVEGLRNIPHIVHRDLKPQNVLQYNDSWNVADFGIARFIEKATSARTVRGFLSSPFAAPEQWRHERATHATDVYALGVLAYLLVSGKLPFNGPESQDFRDQHLHEPAPELRAVSDRYATLVSLMLSKSPETRPNLERLFDLLTDIPQGNGTVSAGAGMGSLAEASRDAARHQEEQAANEERMRSSQEERERIAESARLHLHNIVDAFDKSVRVAAPASIISRSSPELLTIDLGSAQLKMDFLFGGTVIGDDAFKRSSWDVIVGAYIGVAQEDPRPYQWGANLWFTNLNEKDDLRWWEVSYMSNPISTQRRKYQPFPVIDVAEADQAAAPGIGLLQFASNPRPIDQNDVQDFIDRWSGVLADAYQGKLLQPRTLPFTWK